MPGEIIAYAPALLSKSAAEAAAGTTHASGLPLPAVLSDKSSSMSKIGDDVRRADLIADRQQLILGLAVEWISGLNVGVAPGRYRKADGTDVEFAGSSGFAVTDNKSDWLIWIDAATNALAQGQNWPADQTTFVPLALLDSAGGTVDPDSIRDMRALLWNRVPAAASDAGQTNQAAFTIDADNAGSQVDMDLRFNRGSSDAEDAALRYVAASDLFRLLKKHTAGTRAPLDVASLQIGGASIVDSSGYLQIAALSAALVYVFGAGGARITLAGSAGAPAAGTWSSGTLYLDSAGKLYVCTASGTPGTWQLVADQLASPAAGVVTAAALSDAMADTLPQVVLSDATGNTPLSLDVQIKDKQGNNLAEACYVEVGVYQDADGAATATNATIDNTPTTGTFVRWVTTNKVAVYKTDANGHLVIDVAAPTIETFYALAAATTRSRALDCSDIATLTRT